MLLPQFHLQRHYLFWGWFFAIPLWAGVTGGLILGKTVLGEINWSG